MVTLTLQNMELPKIWDLEVLDIKDPVERKNKTLLEEETLIHFKETIKVREDQRYEVSLPWLAGHPPVYDIASFKRPGYTSLNECLSVGPSLSEQIPPLLLRFRTGAIGVIADIKQTFLQLTVKPEDLDYLRFLWWNTEDKSKLEFFRHCRVVFGVTSSTFLLNASIRHHLNSAEFQLESLQQTIEKLKKGFYVDNLTISVENQEELKFKTQTMKIMKAATFELICWANTGVQDQESQNVLGLKWDTETDELNCVSPETDIGLNESISKRKLLSIVNSIYDPIGFTSPVTLLPKLLLQEAKRNKLDWDEDLSSDLQLLLGWITNSEPWNTFGGNRVREIRELTNVEDWRFVPGDLNPTDLPSRSCDWSQLFWSQWWEGPKWLYESPGCWPYTEITLLQEALLERRKSVVVNLTIDINDNFGNRFLYFSSYPKIIRMTAWVLRFCHNLKANSHKLRKELTFQEIQMAEEPVIRIIQAEWLSEMQEKYSKTIQFYEENKILKVRSRLILGEDAEDFVRPTVLPDHPIV
ncbi:integrase catalytic domain-containing protein [Trichonephila clavata]|uniref:Integrase catalytic domain-containing protein n=1 Tax=Trichonephila clavata TaxID=2740835 RepID=A0A8X6GGF6_TRICU|nr:integrase catalytic domain-containing protein [Trichonephila clavata]